MGLLDGITAEDRVDVKFSDFYQLMRESAKADLLCNAVKCDVPHQYIREMLTGKCEAGSVLPPAAQEAAIKAAIDALEPWMDQDADKQERPAPSMSVIDAAKSTFGIASPSNENPITKETVKGE